MNEKKEDNYELNILDFWEKNNTYDKLKQKNKDNKPFYFLQGPPYTSGKIHLGQAWNNTMKDFIIRYKKMNGFDVWNRAGYDMHGLPTEKKVQEKYNLETKKEILNFGLEKFSQECHDFSYEKAIEMNKDLKRLGIDMDFENAYMPINKSYIEGIWWLIKKAHEKNRLYEGLRTTSWCSSCSTALAKHEQEYKELEDTSIYVKFKIKNKDNEYLLIWTTTPWTICYNLAIMINPDLVYAKVKVQSDNNSHNNNIWIVAKELIDKIEFHTNTKLEIVEEFKGEQIEGLEYEHFWKDEIKDFDEIKNNSPKAFTVLLTKEYCTLEAGSGLVHCAPGCGPEDYEVGHENNIPPFNSIDETAKLPINMGKFSGLFAKKDDKKFIEFMQNDNVLAGKQNYVHDYAHCERCHNPVVFKTTKQWFFKTEDIKQDMLKINESVNWNPTTAKNAFNSWLENLRDNSITKQRFWGTPVPIWKCDNCNEYIVIESTKELEKLGAKNIPKENLHKPWIDETTIPCKCGHDMKRITDILDVWIDAGSASWNCLDYPVREDLFNRYFPADFILEGKDQIRGWFNLLMVAGILGLNTKTFKNVYMHGFITDVDGVKMSKSLGNIIKPEEITNKYGADTLRCYMSSTTAGDDVSFSWDEAALRNRSLKILENVSNFLINYSKENSISPEEIKSIEQIKAIEEKYILSNLNKTIKKITQNFENYEIDKISDGIIEFFLDLSRTYIKLIRDKSNQGTNKQKQDVANTIYTCLLNTIKIFNPVAPFICEKIYQDLKEINNNLIESIYFETWPKSKEEFISENLEKELKNMQEIIQVILALRDKSKIGVRWPLKEIIIDTKDNQIKETLDNFEELIKEQTNIKSIRLDKIKLNFKVKPDYNKIGREFGQNTGDILVSIKGKEEEIAKVLEQDKNYEIKLNETFELTKNHFLIEKIANENYQIGEINQSIIALNTIQDEELLKEGFSREITRRIQQKRKEEGLNKNDLVNIKLKGSKKIIESVKLYLNNVKSKVGAIEIFLEESDTCEEKIKNEGFFIEIKK